MHVVPALAYHALIDNIDLTCSGVEHVRTALLSMLALLVHGED